MRKDLKNLLTYGGLAAGGIALFNAVTKASAPAPGVSGLGYVYPPDYHPGHPWWRWHRRSNDANNSGRNVQKFGSPGTDPYWDQSNTFDSPYGPGGNDPYGYGGGYGGGYGSGYGYGGGYGGGGWWPWNYDAQQIEHPGDLASMAAQYD